MPSTTICRGNIATSFLIGPSLTPVAVAQATTAEQSFTIQGLQTNDMVDVYASSAQTAGIGIVNSRVSAANTLQIGFANTTAGSLTPVAGIYLICITRAESLPLPTSAV